MNPPTRWRSVRLADPMQVLRMPAFAIAFGTLVVAVLVGPPCHRWSGARGGSSAWSVGCGGSTSDSPSRCRCRHWGSGSSHLRLIRCLPLPSCWCRWLGCRCLGESWVLCGFGWHLHSVAVSGDVPCVYACFCSLIDLGIVLTESSASSRHRNPVG